MSEPAHVTCCHLRREPAGHLESDAKAAIAGVVLLLFMILGLFGSNQSAAIGLITVVLGRIVPLGSKRQYFATDDNRSERRRGAPFGSDSQDRPSTGW
jgi:hypothetical protein